LGIRGLAGLVGSSLGETDGEHSKSVSISSLDVHMGLNQRLPFANKRAELVGGEVHSVEVGQALSSNNVLNDESHLTVSLVLILLEVGKRNLNNTTLEVVRSNF
jgi:hypothetical protein